MKIVITYGTFDLFHVGHIRLLERLSKLGDRLLVGVSTDEFNDNKGKKSFFSYDERSEILKACRYVDEVFPETDWSQKENDIKRYNADVFAMGDDWKGKFNHLDHLCEVVYLPRTQDISTTHIKNKLSQIKNEDLDKLESSLHSMIEVVKSLSQK
ncbi:glycerol-3-phosphate cytidylyltransferase [Aeromonas sp. HZM]|uniref:glycerol-3-phosphate cytidylyltransferase n=1 Tax=Aeromonas sp. HZM TaxID=1454008 RepID=UPI00067D5C4F|nr:glycerol-3-phosphate cytidylyltransferase [Aeromonas sp. HZM]